MCGVLVLGVRTGVQAGVRYGEVGRRGILQEWCSARDRKRESESPSQPKAQCLSLKAGGFQADQYRWRLRVSSSGYRPDEVRPQTPKLWAPALSKMPYGKSGAAVSHETHRLLYLHVTNLKDQ